MIKQVKFLKGLLLALLAVTLMSGAANALAVTVSCNGTNIPANQIYNSTGVGGTLLAATKYVQIIQSTDAAPGAPDVSTGAPAGDSVISTGTLATAGNFSASVNISTSNYVYIRAWETWNGSGVPTGKYGTSELKNVGTGFTYTFKPASFATTTDMPVQATLSSISPTSRGQGAQSQTLILSGANFQSGATVQISGSGITINSTTVNTAAQITINVNIDAAAATGARSVTVTNPSAAASSAVTFTVNAGPLATSAAPTSADQGYTGNVVLTGTNFHSGAWAAANAVFSGSGITVNSVTYNSATQLTVNLTVAAGATAGGRTITLTNPDDNGKLTSGSIFTVTVPAGTDPQITSITWEPGKDAGYVYGTINLNGTNFGASQGTSTVALQFQGGSYNNLPGAQIYYWSDTKIQVGVPISIGATYAVAGTTNARVTVNAKTAANSFALKPKVYSVTPNNGPVGTSVAIEGTAFNQTAASNSISFNGTAASAGSIVNAADKSTLTVAVPAGATTGQLLVTVNGQTSNTNFDWAPYDQIVFTVTSVAQPTITTNSLPNGTVGTTYNQTLHASGGTAPYTWAITVGSLPAGLSLNTSTGVISGTPTTAQTSSFTVRVTDAAAKTDTKALAITIDPAGIVSDPSISGISPASAYTGQTLIINGSHFGSSGTVTVGGISTQPTVWNDGQIIASIPSGIASGSAAIVVTVSGKTANSTITVDNSRVYLDDFEGGSVGSYTAPGDKTGYYVFGTGITPDNANINANGPQSEAAKEAAKGMKVKYSFTSDWGGGWGAALANQLDLSSAEKINFYLKWDGSDNNLQVGLKDADGTSFIAVVSNATLKALSGYALVTLDKTSFAYDAGGSDATANASFDWSKVANYSFVLNTTGTTANYQYLDSLYATVGKVTPPASTEAPVITSIDPIAGPAGTKLTITGYNFRDKATSTSRKVQFISASNTIIEASIVSWESTQIVLTVPNTLGTGAYDIKVLVEFPSASDPSIIRSFYSNPAAFTVTAVAPGPGAIVAYPTPFNPNTGVPVKIEFDPGTATNIGVYIFDMTAKLVSRQNVTGSPVTWNGVDMYGATVGDGVFLVRIVNNENQGLIAKGKILVVKK